MPEITSKYTAEKGHFYTSDGKPAYTIIGKNGKERNTTLKDARKMGLLPSVTMIIKESAKPGLENWKLDQMLMAALTLTRIDTETDKEYINRIKTDSKSQAIKAAERGNQIHAWIQQGFEGKLSDPDGGIYFHVAKECIEKELGNITWICEQSFSKGRYGGKVDIFHHRIATIDIKTKDTELSDVKLWDEHFMQLAAYRSLDEPCGILFVGTKDVDAKLVWATEDELYRGEKMFNALVDYWYAKTGL
jgi:hypothetical protein